ncbi:hypothetical protein H7J06_10685 [Mycobacterium hodleri]|uniref:hypothetical protein n=1 Tax=Mycolicibacterium hodleri TaxID=49897 RepID=UPI0021F29BD8|nr:hypothetical protein [Mycolicibacterium hodleri]MCV7133448.1 hypothetical protein [Mycolicibacterium hodleri]
MAQLEVDGERLRREVRTFEALEEDRAGHEARVGQIAGNLVGEWKGESGSAVQKALSDYLAASAALRAEEQEMNVKMEIAVDRYLATDEATAGGLESQMGF